MFPSSHDTREPLVAIVIPAYRARDTIRGVVQRALAVADFVIVVDDACPESTGDVVRSMDARVHVLEHVTNRGVGGASKTGIAEALRLGAEYVVKLDADDQMDASFVPMMVELLERHHAIDLIKGNRFADAGTLQTMPVARLIGNAALTLLVKFSSGYWTIVDPTNGFIALRADSLRHVNFTRLADRYFFEIDLLCMFGLRRAPIAELEMPAIYGAERSSLSIPHVLWSFPLKLVSRFLRRLVMNYLVVEINVGSLCGLIGIPLLVFALIFGGREWMTAAASGVPRPAGTVVLALLLFMTGFQLTLQALLYDVQFSTKTVKFRADRTNRLIAEPVAVNSE